MSKNIRFKIRHSIVKVIATVDLRLVVLIFGFIALIITRQCMKSFGLSLGYLYVTLISFSGFWFRIRGGVITAAIASAIFIFEILTYRHWPNSDIVLMGAFLRLLVYFFAGITMGYFSAEEKKLKTKLQELSQYDELTGCVNFRWTMRLLEQELSRSKRYSKEMSLVLIDIDHFKKINDNYGHLVGNDVLKAFSQILKNSVRNIDTVCRYGGEEFLIILPEATLEQASFALQRIKDKTAKAAIGSDYLRKEEHLSVTFSAGGASFPHNGDNLNSLISVADNALYQAKRAGRNQAVIERRRWVRVKPIPGIKMQIENIPPQDELQHFEIENISLRGMRILFPQALYFSNNILVFFPNTFPYIEFNCRMSLPQESASYTVKCKVIHQGKFDNSWHRVGLFFSEIPAIAEEKLRRHINNNLQSSAS